MSLNVLTLVFGLARRRAILTLPRNWPRVLGVGSKVSGVWVEVQGFSWSGQSADQTSWSSGLRVLGLACRIQGSLKPRTLKPYTLPLPSEEGTTQQSRSNSSNGVEDLHLKAKARIWP
jgi:hypothetical protein